MSFTSRSGALFCAASGFWLLACAGAYAMAPSAEYDVTIRAARAGAVNAIEKLEQWQRLNPADARLVYDLAVVLGMQGRHQAALQYYARIVNPEAPAYAIRSMAASARAASRPADAERAYRLLLTKVPSSAEAHAGLAYAWMDLGRADDALTYVMSRLPATSARYTPGDIPLLVALAELRELRREWLLAADAYMEVLKQDPGFRYALRGRVFALSRAGIPQLAKRLADSRPEFFDDEERWRLAHDAAARAIVFGQARIASDDTPLRFTETDAALVWNAEVSRSAEDKTATRFDRLVALRDRTRMREAVELYESLVAAKVAVPSYAKAAAADAYLYLEQPELARDLYLDTLKVGEKPDPNEWMERQIGLMQAYSEAEQHDKAQAAADELIRITPAVLHKGLPGLSAPNPAYTRATLMTALMPMYADRLDAAEERLSESHALAPASAEIHSAWASLQATRERTRAALEEFTLLQIDDPKSIDAAVGRAEAMLALSEFEEARAQLGPLLSGYPENKAVQNLARKLELHDRPQLNIDVKQGRGGGTATADSVFDAMLHSAPLKGLPGDHYRAFAHINRSNGETGNASVTRTRFGAGMDYRARDIAVEAELNRATDEAQANGLLLSMTNSLADAWHVHTVVDTNVNDLPAAAYRNDVTAKAFTAGITWIMHESRKAGAELSQLRFSDDNIRHAARLWWYERWISGPVFKLDSTLAFYRSSNSLDGAAYFSPTRDREASLSMAGEWLTWRRYHRAFKQRLTYTPAYYWQQGFARGTAGDLRYEHEWSDNRNVALRYGVGRSSHPYDGNREDRNYGFLTLYWQIK
jgi:biofilm PGA synthesis protein PgaA